MPAKEEEMEMELLSTGAIKAVQLLIKNRRMTQRRHYYYYQVMFRSLGMCLSRIIIIIIIMQANLQDFSQIILNRERVLLLIIKYWWCHHHFCSAIYIYFALIINFHFDQLLANISNILNPFWLIYDSCAAIKSLYKFLGLCIFAPPSMYNSLLS